jgi:hypothetical protein
MVPVPDWYEFTFSAQTSNLPVFPQEVFDDPQEVRSPTLASMLFT